jgi:hypothetical protein
MFAWKSMDDNSNLVKLKLDMVYRGLSTETASARFTEITPPEQRETEKKKPKKKLVRVAVPQTKPLSK